jgi:hypothetical protein
MKPKKRRKEQVVEGLLHQLKIVDLTCYEKPLKESNMGISIRFLLTSGYRIDLREVKYEA